MKLRFFSVGSRSTQYTHCIYRNSYSTPTYYPVYDYLISTSRKRKLHRFGELCWDTNQTEPRPCFKSDSISTLSLCASPKPQAPSSKLQAPSSNSIPGTSTSVCSCSKHDASAVQRSPQNPQTWVLGDAAVSICQSLANPQN